MENSIEWVVAEGLIPYPEAVAAMKAQVEAIETQGARERVWLLEHPPLYTTGALTHPDHVRQALRCPVYATDRGGQATYHGPGQRVAYVMLDLRPRRKDVHWYVYQLEQWLIETLKDFDIQAERRPGRVGLWVVDAQGREAKIAAIGVRLRRWITFHGIALNVNPDLSYFQEIVPCGLPQYGVTSMYDAGFKGVMQEVDAELQKHFSRLFG